MQTKYDLLNPEVLANPYPLYHQMRNENPVYLDADLGCWVLTRYQDVISTFSNASISSKRMKEDRLLGKTWEEIRPLLHTCSLQMVFLDPPDHTRLRFLVHKAFSHRTVETMRLHVQQVVDMLLDAVQEQQYMDVIGDLAFPLPAIIIAEMLGVPPEDHPKFKKWTNDFAVFMGTPTTLEQSKQATQSVLALMDYFRYIVNRRRVNPIDDLLGSLIAAEREGDKLSEEELLANCVLLLFAGHEASTNLIGNGLNALLRQPALLQKLKEQPELITSAVEELLRYDSPTQWTARITKEETVIGSKLLGRGQGVLLMLGAANRDPLQFPNPDELDICRRENRHIAFGHSAHFCLGAALARLEGQISIATLLRRFPKLRLQNETVEWQGSLGFRSLKALPITF
jgi:pimeloyl-[acyl-carrier protein] synthase